MTKLITYRKGAAKLIRMAKPYNKHETVQCPDDLRAMLSYSRPHEGRSEGKFIRRFLVERGFRRDFYGNYWGFRPYTDDTDDKPRTLWVAHSDSVSRHDGRQSIYQSGNLMYVAKNSPASCLGADNAAGVWMLCRLFDAGKPGAYVVCRGEEIGGLGSDWLSRQHPDLLAEYDYAIAFDRRGFGDVITHQGGTRTASHEFASALADELGNDYAPCTGGVFTDTANFVDHIAECTNISVGFEHEHTSAETLHVGHITELLDRMLTIDIEALPVARDPDEEEPRSSIWADYYDQYTVEPVRRGWETEDDAMDYRSLVEKISTRHFTYDEAIEAIWRNPDAVLEYFIHLGHDVDSVMTILESYGAQLYDKPSAY